ncbi:MAG: nitronate monooxygenase [Bacillota bacterium]
MTIERRFDDNIARLLGTKYPIIQGGMANIADHRLAAAVSNAGGLGLIATGGWGLERIREEIQKTRTRTSNPFGLNIMLMHPLKDEIAQLAIEEGVQVITTGAGNPSPFIEAWKEAGIIVIPVVPSVALAKRVARYGADAVIVEGTEAGGHIGETTTFTLVPQVVDAVGIPVIAAGGIADARGVDAAFALGAKGVQVGTVLLSALECPIHEQYKEKIIKAKDTDTVVTGREAKAPVRVLKNKMAVQYLKLSSQGVDRDELEALTLGSLSRAVNDGDVDRGSFMAGQVSGLIRSVRTVEDILRTMVHESLLLGGLYQ